VNAPDTTLTRKSKAPTVALDDEATAYLAAMNVLAGLPGYEGPTPDELTRRAAEAASKAVHAAYLAVIGKAK
jgi:hypothetical protein